MSDADADWPFDQAPNVAALTVRAILEGAPILHVSHDADDEGWQFLDGRPPQLEDGRVIGMRGLLNPQELLENRQSFLKSLIMLIDIRQIGHHPKCVRVILTEGSFRQWQCAF